MSSARRVQQWATFGRMWYLFDAKWQNPYEASNKIVKILSGSHKPIFHNDSDCGDHVVVINSAHIALPGDEWERRVFYHNTGYRQGASWTLAHQIHEKDKTLVFKRAIYHALDTSLRRHARMCRLHIFPGEEVPEEILKNVSAQLRQMRAVPKRLDHYTEEEVLDFPKVFDWPKEYVLESK